MSSKRSRVIGLIGIPIALLLLSELVLRVIGYNDKDLLFHETKIDDEPVYVLNTNAAGRFVADARNTPRGRSNEYFRKEKPKDGLRIFCLGGSTVYGFPHPSNVTVSHFLETRLSEVIPSKEVEVINAGVPLLSSFAVTEFASEIVENYTPDILLVYLGHDEFYGALGVGSHATLDMNPKWIRLHLTLQEIHVYRAGQDLIRWVTQKLGGDEAESQGANIYQKLIDDREIVLGSPVYEEAKTYFRENLVRIIETAREHGVTVVVSNVVSNERDMEPFASEFSESLDETEQEKWQDLLNAARDSMAVNEPEAALELLLTAQEMDGKPAILHYELASLYESLGETEKAKAEYGTALDLDVMRLRAAREFNDIIKEICLEQKTPLVDMKAFFEKNSEHDVVGNNLLSDHVNPNFIGTFLMAKILTHSLFASKAVSPATLWDWEKDLDDTSYFRQARVTGLDTTIGNMRSKFLLSQWPFRKYKVFFKPGVKTKKDRLALQVIQNKMGWEQAHFELAEHYKALDNYAMAREEYLAVFQAQPFRFEPLLLAADCELAMGNLDRADSLYANAAELAPDSPFTNAKLGILHYAREDFLRAVQYLEKAIGLDSSQQAFTERDKKEVTYYLSKAYFEAGVVDSARKHLQPLLEMYPDDQQISQLSDELNMPEGAKNVN